MENVHICLVSEQTIPNILSIYHFNPDKVVFCTTESMEKKKRTDAIMNVLKLYGRDYSECHDRISVNQDCLDDCESKFSIVAENYRGSEVVVNLTGGTKIMVLAAYDAFKIVKDIKMVYTPIPRNDFIEVYPRTHDCVKPQPYSLKLSVEAYVTAYGVSVKNKNKIDRLKINANNNKDISDWIVKNYKGAKDILAVFYTRLGNHRDDKNFEIEIDYYPSAIEKEFLDRFGIQGEKIKKTLSKNQIRFLTGDWLSDFCFIEICKLEVDDCVTGIKLVSLEDTDNEFDVMFTKDNALYIVECKSLKQNHDKDVDILYKIMALQQDFGLRVDGFLVSTAINIPDRDGKVTKSVLQRARQCNTKVIHPDEIKNVSEWIRNQVKGLN